MNSVMLQVNIRTVILPIGVLLSLTVMSALKEENYQKGLL